MLAELRPSDADGPAVVLPTTLKPSKMFSTTPTPEAHKAYAALIMAADTLLGVLPNAHEARVSVLSKLSDASALDDGTPMAIAAAAISAACAGHLAILTAGNGGDEDDPAI